MAGHGARINSSWDFSKARIACRSLGSKSTSVPELQALRVSHVDEHAQTLTVPASPSRVLALQGPLQTLVQHCAALPAGGALFADAAGAPLMGHLALRLLAIERLWLRNRALQLTHQGLAVSAV